MTPDNKYVLAANPGTKDNPSTTVSIVDTATFAVVGTVETGQGAHGVVVDPSSKYAYITNIYGNDVAVIDIAAQKVIATVPTAAGPNGISFSPMAPATAGHCLGNRNHDAGYGQHAEYATLIITTRVAYSPSPRAPFPALNAPKCLWRNRRNGAPV